MPLTIQLEPSAQQTAFNLKRWAELLADPELARLPHRIETDRHGHILMSPPPAPKHGNFQSEVAHLLRCLLSAGRVITECPLSTSDGVKALDVTWLRPGRAQELRSTTCLVCAPEVCVEVLSVSNTPAEIAEKIALYFEAGAQEVWICDQDGTLEFHFSTPPEIRDASEICPNFPSVVCFSGEWADDGSVSFGDPTLEWARLAAKAITPAPSNKAALEYIAERNGKRDRMSDIPFHRLWQSADAGRLNFVGLRLVGRRISFL